MLSGFLFPSPSDILFYLSTEHFMDSLWDTHECPWNFSFPLLNDALSFGLILWVIFRLQELLFAFRFTADLEVVKGFGLSVSSNTGSPCSFFILPANVVPQLHLPANWAAVSAVLTAPRRALSSWNPRVDFYLLSTLCPRGTEHFLSAQKVTCA